MKVLSILQPWGSLIIKGHKKIETRSWIPKNPEIIKQLKEEGLLIHASIGKQFRNLHDTDPLYTFYFPLFAHNKIEPIEKLPFGAIIGKVNVDGFYRTDDLVSPSCKHYAGIDRISEQEEAFGDYSPGRFGWLLSDPVEFEVPIPAKGQLNLWNFDPDAFWAGNYNLPIYGIDGEVISKK